MPSKKPRVLIVDDNQGVQILLRVLLNTDHCAVIQATNNDEAKAALLMQPLIDLIILDLKMPGGDGNEFLEWREKNADLNKIPIIVLSGDVSIEEISRQYHIEFFLQKGGHPSLLLEMIQKNLQRRGYVFPLAG